MHIDKKIISCIVTLSVYLFYLLGVIIRSLSLQFQSILHISSDWIAGIGLLVIFIGLILRFYFPPKNNKKLLSKKTIFLLLTSSIGCTCLMYHLHNIFNMSSVNNDLCDAGWNFVSLYLPMVTLILYEEYLKLR